jgi:hypothetical protein
MKQRTQLIAAAAISAAALMATVLSVPSLVEQAFAQVAEEEDTNNIAKTTTKNRSNANCNYSGLGSGGCFASDSSGLTVE